jgi:hypothetical protein
LYESNPDTSRHGPEHLARHSPNSGRHGQSAGSRIAPWHRLLQSAVPSGCAVPGQFEHNGSVATLADWFDARHLRDDYVPTGFVGHGLKTRPVRGHEYGLMLSSEDKAALISFLNTL